MRLVTKLYNKFADHLRLSWGVYRNFAQSSLDCHLRWMRSPWRQSDTFTCFNSFTICFAAALRYRIFIPTAVYQELTVDPPVPGTIEVQTLQWLEVRSVSVRAMVEQLQTRAQLDPGESEAIALALEINADLLLLMSVVVEQKQTVWASGLLGC